METIAKTTLFELLQDPQQAGELPQDEIFPILCKVGTLQGALLAALAKNQSDGTKPPQEDRLLKVSEAAKVLGMTQDYLRRNSSELPFVVRPTPHQLRFSLLGIQKFIKTHGNQ